MNARLRKQSGNASYTEGGQSFPPGDAPLLEHELLVGPTKDASA